MATCTNPTTCRTDCLFTGEPCTPALGPRVWASVPGARWGDPRHSFRGEVIAVDEVRCTYVVTCKTHFSHEVGASCVQFDEVAA